MVKDPVSGLMYFEPVLPVTAMDTFAIKASRRNADCNEPGVECDFWETGWYSTFDESTPLGIAQAGYVRFKSGRKFVEKRLDSGLTEFWFPPHQRCFNPHSVPDADEVFIQRGGDWRGDPDPHNNRRRFSRPDDWVDAFANRTIWWHERIQRG
jgi:hypothetical protein